MGEAAGSSLFLQLFNAIGGGKRVAVLISAFFDESSESDSKNGLLVVCGYALDPAGLRRFTPLWRKMLRKYQIPYFRMSDCNSGTGVFEHLDYDKRDRCARRAIKLARRYPLVGYAYVVNQTDYREILQDNGFDCDPYSFLIWGAFIHANKWVLENLPDHKVSLFFEAGYETQPQANDLLRATLKKERVGATNIVTYAGFVRKEDSEAAQAGDLIAWHVRKGLENQRDKKPIRKDTLALIADKSIRTIEHSADRLRGLRASFEKKAGSLANASKFVFSEEGQHF